MTRTEPPRSTRATTASLFVAEPLVLAVSLFLGFFVAADIRFVGFHDFGLVPPSGPENLRGLGHKTFIERMRWRYEPRRLVGHVDHAVQLVRGDAFLAGAHQEGCHQPLVQRNVRPLADRPHRRP